MLGIQKIYKYSNYPTSISFSDLAFNTTTLCVVSSTTNSIWYCDKTTGTFTSSHLPTTSETGIIFVGCNNDNEFYFGHDWNVSVSFYGDYTISYFATQDFTTYSTKTNIMVYAESYRYDSTNQQDPCQLMLATLYGYRFKKKPEYYGKDIVDFSYSISVYIDSTGYCPDNSEHYKYIYTATGITTITCSGAGNLHDKVFFENTASNTFIYGDGICCYASSVSILYTIKNETVTRIYKTEGSVTTTISLDSNYSATCCDCRKNGNLLIGGKNGILITYDNNSNEINYSNENDNKDINEIYYDEQNDDFIIIGNGVIFNVNLPVYSTSNLSSQFLAIGLTTSLLPSQFVVCYTGNDNLPSQFQSYQNDLINLASQVKTLQSYQKKLQSILLTINVPSRTFDIKYRNKKLSDYGIYIEEWQDEFIKDIDIERDYTKHGFNINRFNYFGGNHILLNGFLKTTTLTNVQQLLNDFSYGVGKLYKRKDFYTIAELEKFDIGNSLNGYIYPINLQFIAEKPYYEFENTNEFSATYNFTKTVTGIKLYNTLVNINDNTELILQGSITFSDEIITTAYQPMAKYADTYPYNNDLTVSDISKIDKFDTRNNSLGVKFGTIVYLNRFYISLSSTVSDADYNNQFEIYYRNINTKQWEKYNLPFIIYIQNIAHIGKCLIFDNLLLNTYEFKVRYKNYTTDGNLIIPSDKIHRIIVVPKYFSFFKMMYGESYNAEFRFDIKNAIFYVNNVEKMYKGQMLRIYPKITYLWVAIGGETRPIKVKYKFNEVYYPI